jgi:L-iditol 2-dehydrogenase
MRAAVFYGPGNIANQEVYCDFRYAPKEKLTSDESSNGDILLKVKACAVCGYDVRVFRNGHNKVAPPVILGHEICGLTNQDLVVMNASDSDEKRTREYRIRAGSRVAVSPIIPCLNCVYCHNRQYNLCLNLKEIGSSINGGFGEFVKIPKQVQQIGGLVRIPDNLGDEEAALLEPLACCLNGLYHIDPLIRKNEQGTVAIIGDGPIGLLHLQLVKKMYHLSTVVVIGRISQRLQQAKSMGANATVAFANDADFDHCLQNTLALTDNVGFNVVIIATSNPIALNFALKIASKDSCINIFAGMLKSTDNFFSLDPNFLHYNQISITGSFSSTPSTLAEAVKHASSGEVNLSKLVSHTYRLQDIIQAIVSTEKYHGLRAVINRF